MVLGATPHPTVDSNPVDIRDNVQSAREVCGDGMPSAEERAAPDVASFIDSSHWRIGSRTFAESAPSGDDHFDGLTGERIVCTCRCNVYAIPCDAVHHTGVRVRIESTLERQIG